MGYFGRYFGTYFGPYFGSIGVAPTDEIALALDHLMRSVAASASFQEWTGTSGEDDARARVHAGESADDDAQPLAIAWLKSYGAIRVAAGQRDEFDADGVLMLQLVAEVDAGGSEDAYVSMCNVVGAIRRDVLGRSGTAGYLSCAAMTVRAVYRFEPEHVAASGRDIWVGLLEITVRP